MTVPELDVAIVGAGLSGLAAAHLLHEAGLKITVLEASNRIGGRIHSVRDAVSGRYLADLGPTWVWPVYQPVAAKWLARLKIETFEQFETGNAVLDMDPDGPVQHQPLPGQHGIRRIVGGPQALVDALQARLPVKTIRTAQRVTSLGLATNGLVLDIADAKPVTARYVIMAMPLRLAVETISWPGEMTPALLATMADMPTWMASQAKAVILYDQPFWHDSGLSGRVASQIGPLVEVHDHCSGDSAALFGFIGWPHELRKAEGQALKDQISAQLVRCFGKEAAGYKNIYIEDWARNKFVCSDLDRTRTPAHPEVGPGNLRQPHCKGRLYFSVAETAEQSPGLVEGALAAADTTVAQMLSELAG